MKKEKTIKAHQHRLKNGKVITVHEHKASYNAAEELKKAMSKAVGAGGELEALKNKKPVAQEEDEKSPYDSMGFTKDEFKEWYEGTGSKADKKVEKALRKALGTKAYNEFNDRAADEYKAGGAHSFFMKESKNRAKADLDSKISSYESKYGKLGKESKIQKTASKGKTSDDYMGLSKSDLKKRIAEVAKSFGDKVSSEDFKVTGENHRFSYELPHGGGGGFKTEREALTELLKAAEKLQKNNPNLETRRPGGWMSQPLPGEGAIRLNPKRKPRSAGSKSPEDDWRTAPKNSGKYRAGKQKEGAAKEGTSLCFAKRN